MKSLLNQSGTAFMLAFVAACTGRGPSRADSATSGSPARSAPASPSIVMAVTEHGIGPLRAGMTIPEAQAVFGGFAVPKRVEDTNCNYASAPGLPAGVSVMVENGIVVRVDVDSSNVPTAEGAQVGDSEARVRALYGKRLTVSPHKYTDGHYLTVKALSPSDTLHLIIFETDNGLVVSVRAGQRPQVEYVEGCS